MNLISISEIDNVKSACSPHAEELKNFGKEWSSLFREFDREDLEKVSRSIKGEMDELGIDEEWALTKELFPEVRVHISYHYYGEEFSSYGEEDKLRFLFSGDRVKKVTGEDLAGMIEVILNFIGRITSGKVRGEGGKRKKLRERYFEPRKKAITFLNTGSEEEMDKLEKFLGGRLTSKNSKKILEKEFFQNVSVRINIVDDELEGLYLQDETDRMADYEKDALIVYTLNHIIRFITQGHPDRDLPEFCNKVFPRKELS